ncbi:MAG TPA: very short patch repair endonuclease [Thermoplasmata archaeon]|nr:very short patch repair endonuclease [Thermoplasmata archaeon]
MPARPTELRRTYLRDGRAPLPDCEITSRVMSANRGKNTKPELALRHELRVRGLLGYRLHRPEVPGRPDVSFGRERLAVFVNGCFWHRCPKCQMPLPRTHTEFWEGKFEANRQRDVAKRSALRGAGWNVLTLWECEIRDSPARSADRVLAALEMARSRLGQWTRAGTPY